MVAIFSPACILHQDIMQTIMEMIVKHDLSKTQAIELRNQLIEK